MNNKNNKKEFDIIKITTTASGEAMVQFNVNFSILLKQLNSDEKIYEVSEKLKNMFTSEIDRVVQEYIQKIKK